MFVGLDTALKKAEYESFFKSFGVFFIALSILSGILFYVEYTQLKHDLDEKLYNQMRLCSYDLKCTQFEFDFVPSNPKKLYELQHSSTEMFVLFSIPRNDTYALKLSLLNTKYETMIATIRNDLLFYYGWALLIIAIISALFSFYTLYPLRRALHLTQEFSRDILHDLNTPLSALRLNVSLLKPSAGDEKKIDRMFQSIDTIVSLGDNLRSYLEEHSYQVETFDLHTLIQNRISTLEKLYPSIYFILNAENITITTNRDAFIRIIDNLLNNAAKYNKHDGTVTISINSEQNKLYLQDTGRGIAHPEKIFERFYKEHDRGLGIGLHIVKKFCDELKIPIDVESRISKGTIFTLDLGSLTKH
ncbi:HAMP domain-containing sensor histidine kinase [Sulfuricurvum sp.]|uniref:sensor histidine kinase n=1 Tax=Sulfuricurvum sp. TaxID=2025608 RepID=UPI002629B7C1|nr:HAMP domain-containing sensor histidine kinase [Sulfuricurvum sp.]MDD2782091.1 HAMP domain-containing sensor histidine kinase [Sulfuricurvum sp.]